MQGVDYGAHISYQISISIILSMPVFNFDGHILLQDVDAPLLTSPAESPSPPSNKLWLLAGETVKSEIGIVEPNKLPACESSRISVVKEVWTLAISS
jgi:hypothetical protein